MTLSNEQSDHLFKWALNTQGADRLLTATNIILDALDNDPDLINDHSWTEIYQIGLNN